MFRYQFQEKGICTSHLIKLPEIIQISKSHDSYRWTAPHHLHHKHIELAYIEKGIAYYTINGQSITAKAGDFLVIEKDVLHSVTSSTENPTDIWVIYAADFQFWGLESEKLLIDKNFIILNTNLHNDFIFSIYKEIKYLYEKNAQDTYFICQSVLSSLLVLIYNIQNDAEHISFDTSSNFVKKIMFYLNEHFKENINLKDLARHFNVSVSYISHSFANEYKISPINYIIDRKLCEAKWLLTSTDKTLNDISYCLGYDNVNHFTNLFTKRIGCSPSKYRENTSDEFCSHGISDK